LIDGLRRYATSIGILADRDAFFDEGLHH
jgi:hypothetical protein